MPHPHIATHTVALFAAALAVALFLAPSWRPAGLLMTGIPAAGVSVSFSPERCAELHNSLLHKAIENEPSLVPEQSLADRLLGVAPELSAKLQSSEHRALVRFLSLLQTTALPNGRLVALTPEMYQPDPSAFSSETFRHEPGFLLLYPQNNADSPMDGGLFLDIQTLQAVWHVSPGPFPPPDRWVSLESVLQRALEKWNRGKYFWDPQSESISVARWSPSDLSEALSAWETLVSAIEARLPSNSKHVDPAPTRRAPLDYNSMKSYRMSEFSRAFLSRATRPGFTYVAPGVTIFSPQSLADVYSPEAEDSYRRTQFIAGFFTEEEQEWASLVLPGSAVIPSDASRGIIPDYEEASDFDKPWGFGKFTVNRWAGLYIEQDTWHADGVRLVTPAGHTMLCDFRGRCPWGASRSPRLSEVLMHWTSLVEDNTWPIGSQGVDFDSAGWFDSHPSTASLDWSQATI